MNRTRARPGGGLGVVGGLAARSERRAHASAGIESGGTRAVILARDGVATRPSPRIEPRPPARGQGLSGTSARASGAGRPDAPFVRHAATARVQVALADDPQEQLLQRRRRVVDGHAAPPPCRAITSRISCKAASEQVARLDLGHVLHRQQVGDLAELLQLAVVQDRDPVADVLHVGQQVAAQDDRLALVAQLADQVLHLGRADRVEARGRLVEQDQLGVVDQRLGQADPPLHALGVFAELACLAAFRPTMSISRSTRLRPLGRRDVEQPAVEVERLLGVEELVEVRLLGQVADPLVLGDVGGRLVEDQRLALGGEEQAEQQLDRGRLARAVGAEQAEDLAPMDLQVERLQRLDLRAAPEVAVDLGQVPGLDDDVTAHHEGALCKTRWTSRRTNNRREGVRLLARGPRSWVRGGPSDGPSRKMEDEGRCDRRRDPAGPIAILRAPPRTDRDGSRDGPRRKNPLEAHPDFGRARRI